MVQETEEATNFRLIFDMQSVVPESIPWRWIQNECMIFYMSVDNIENLEEYNDVWTNMIQGDIFNAEELRSEINCSQETTLGNRIKRKLVDIDEKDRAEDLKLYNDQFRQG